MIKLSDTKNLYKSDQRVRSQLEQLFDAEDIDQYTSEYDPFWDEMLPQAIKMHESSGVGEYAGSGCVDYNEGRGLYMFVRKLEPEVVVELGYAGGISTSFIAYGLKMNGHGEVHTVDLSPQYWDVCPTFQNYRDQGIIHQYHTTDAVDFLKECELDIDLTFSDATHEKEPTKRIAMLLREKWPNTIHLYHEWGMSEVSGGAEKSFVSMRNLIGTQYERDAFEEVFGDEYRHGGLYGSCGLGIVTPM